jgi:hypothetical protein
MSRDQAKADAPAALAAAVERIARLSERTFLARSPFHLARCGGCDGPSYQQPCPHCRFYPMGDAAELRARTPRLTAEAFGANVSRSLPDGNGNLATWYFSGFRRNAIHGKDEAFTAAVSAAIAEASGWEGLPSATEAFEAIASVPSVTRRPQDPTVTALWDGLRELQASLSRHDERASRGTGTTQPPPEGFRERLRETGGLVVKAAHEDGDWDEAREAIEELAGELIRDARKAGSPAGWIPLGNLITVVDGLARAAEARGVRAPAP